MTEIKHTPGPWKIVRHMGFGINGVKETDDPECQMGFAGPNGERVCWFGQSANYEPTEGDEPSEADARLMVAASELLEALRLFVDEYTELVNSGDAGRWDPEEERKVIVARAAIAKAEGRA